jgi:hypothetical protein
VSCFCCNTCCANTHELCIQASGITLRPERRYTILAPTDAAFAAALRKSLRMKPADLLAPAMADKLRKVGMQSLTNSL